MLHIPGLGFDGLVGYSPIAMAKNAIGLSIAAEEYGSKFFANGATSSGILEYPGTIKDPEKVRESWNAGFGGSSNAHKVAVLEEGMKMAIVEKYPDRAYLLKQFMGSADFINKKLRYCLWLDKISPKAYRDIPSIMERLKKVVEMRS